MSSWSPKKLQLNIFAGFYKIFYKNRFCLSAILVFFFKKVVGFGAFATFHPLKL